MVMKLNKGDFYLFCSDNFILYKPLENVFKFEKK